MAEPIKSTTARGRMAAYWLTGLALTVVFAVLHGHQWRGGVGLHTLMETLATLLAAIVGAMALVRFYSKKDNTFLFIGAGFLGTAFLDGYHAVVTSEFFRPFMPSDLSSLIPWSWVASRQFLAILMFLSWFAWLREQRLGPEGKVSEPTVYIFTVAFTFLSFLFFAFVPLPPAYYPDIIFHRPEEFGPAIFFLIALVGYLKKGHWRDDAFEHWLVLSLIVGFIGQAMFMSHSGQLFDYEFDIAHLHKKVSYVCVLTGLMINMFTTFRGAEENEARFRGAIESLQESFALYDSDDRLVIYNDEFVRIHASIQDVIKPGLSFEGLIRASVKRGIITEAIGREEQYIQERVRQHRSPSEMIVRQLADGSWYIINEARTPDGGIAVTQTDITELKDAEKALREGEERLKAIIDTVPALINLKDTEGRYQMTNRHHNEFFGFEAGELIGKTSSALSKEHGDRVRELDRTILKTGEALGAYDYQMTDVKGRKRDLLTTKIPLRNLSNEIVGILSTSVDITDRKQAEEALRESEARTRAIVSNVIDGIITIDEGGMIHTVNPAAERMFGYSERELVGQNINVLAAEPYRSAHDRFLANYLTTGVKKIIGMVRELEAERRNGKRFPIELAISEVRLGDERMFVGILRDITQRKEMERLKGEFVSTVSHELRTPLTSIRGSLGLITGGAVGKLSGKVREMIDVAEKNTERLINLVNDILDMEKIESGSMEFSFGPLDLARLVEQGIETNKGYAEDQGVEFLLTETLPDLTVRGDGDRLMQVMANLLSNAAKFSPKGEKVEISVTRHNDKARVSVSDHGPGIPKEFENEVFSKFTQADSSDTRQVGGTGLGLNISKTIIDKHDGIIGFDTEAGKGTTFYFEVPFYDEGAAEEASPPPPTAKHPVS